MTSRTAAVQWVTLDVGYVDPQRRSCVLCGRPLARQIWRQEVGGNMLEFCEPAHVDLSEYLLPSTEWNPLFLTCFIQAPRP